MLGMLWIVTTSGGEEDSGDDLERFVLCALGTDATLQGIAAFNYVGCHVVVSGTGA